MEEMKALEGGDGGQEEGTTRETTALLCFCYSLFPLSSFLIFPLHVMFVIEFASKIFLEAETSDKKRR